VVGGEFSGIEVVLTIQRRRGRLGFETTLDVDQIARFASSRALTLSVLCITHPAARVRPIHPCQQKRRPAESKSGLRTQCRNTPPTSRHVSESAMFPPSFDPSYRQRRSAHPTTHACGARLLLLNDIQRKLFDFRTSNGDTNTTWWAIFASEIVWVEWKW
jgi:membrane carboxypeptidase/penicillin-binding protein PbpC